MFSLTLWYTAYEKILTYALDKIQNVLPYLNYQIMWSAYYNLPSRVTVTVIQEALARALRDTLWEFKDPYGYATESTSFRNFNS